MLPTHAADIILRTNLKPGDLGAIVHLHGVVYAAERGWDSTFEAYVARPLAEFVLAPSPRQRVWIAETADHIVGVIAIIERGPATAQLRWFLVDPSIRGRGLGTRLLQEAIRFAGERGYAEILLWTERSLTSAARLYEAAGFRKTAEKPGRMWGAEVVEQEWRL